MEDTDDIIINGIYKTLTDSELSPIIQATIRHSFSGFDWLTEKSSEMNPVLEKIWVNFQEKHQFNPLHSHTGIFSFVIWMDIPYKLEDEYNLPWVKGSNSPRASNFMFVDSMGMTTPLEVDKSFEGVCCFFPSSLKHMVYPFYTSNLKRVSISGNISYA